MLALSLMSWVGGELEAGIYTKSKLSNIIFWKLYLELCCLKQQQLHTLSLMSWVGGEGVSWKRREMNGLHSKADISWYVNSTLTTCAHFAWIIMMVLFNKFEYSNNAADTVVNMICILLLSAPQKAFVLQKSFQIGWDWLECETCNNKNKLDCVI